MLCTYLSCIGLPKDCPGECQEMCGMYVVPPCGCCGACRVEAPQNGPALVAALQQRCARPSRVLQDTPC